MFTLGDISIRPMEPGDIDMMYQWHLDHELETYSGWGNRRSEALFRQKYEGYIMNPPADFIMFSVVAGDVLCGRVELAMIDTENRKAAVGILLGNRTVWNRGVGRTALRLLIDYAFTVKNLERVYAEAYDFNERSSRTLEGAGFMHEGTLRSHEHHHGKPRDMRVYGLLKEEFYNKYESIFLNP
ncbi:GNAT family N-acetyltransferase [Paenibacillus gansuensis]|uniref:GNAT family N-acetyltransferase n=1 Tax=Paenibacillus gansuensis TaxID=306542 RepID=A0ABW5PAD0_9BACL